MLAHGRGRWVVSQNRMMMPNSSVQKFVQSLALMHTKVTVHTGSVMVLLIFLIGFIVGNEMYCIHFVLTDSTWSATRPSPAVLPLVQRMGSLPCMICDRHGAR